MLSDTKLSLLHQLVQSASSEEIIWTNGYLAGLLDKNSLQLKSETQAAVTVKPTIIYGTETGNSKKVATGLLANFKQHKIQAKAADVFQYDIARLEKESLVLFVMSTQGEGEFPQNAVAFYENLQASSTNLIHLSYAVLGLGDASYPLFCNAGVLLDEVLEQRGAKRLLPLVKSDVDYHDVVVKWQDDLKNVFLNNKQEAVGTSTVKDSATGKQNYKGTVSHKIVLNDIGSNKETYHIEIDTDEEVQYEPGDALGIIPKNNSDLINTIVHQLNAELATEIVIKENKATLGAWLERLNITNLSKRTIEQIAILFKTKIEKEKASLSDILAAYPIPLDVTVQNVLSVLLPIAPRLYSISSCGEAHNGQVHLTVGLTKFYNNGDLHIGLASHYLASLANGANIDFYIHKNKNFKLSANYTDIIMIGPGTGIAPFRSFISYRDATGADGKNWLFFGEQHFVQDFYYQTEIQDWLSSGVLNKLDVAFSRDQKEKIYVQDRIRQNGSEFNDWINNGATVYVCGQKLPMSADVENTIIEVIATQRNISIDDAKAVLELMETEGRYQKDVY
jgi:sulfite reductase (NADPH) flavoprotein alpha-component